MENKFASKLLEQIYSKGSNKSESVTFDILPLFTYISKIIPTLLFSFFILDSALNKNSKAFILIMGVIMSFFITMLFNSGLTNALGKPASGKLDQANFCTSYNNPFFSSKQNYYNIPSSSVLIMSFIIGYIGLSVYNLDKSNLPFFIVLLILTFSDITAQLSGNCTNIEGVFIGLFLGIGFGIAWWMLVYKVKKDQLYFYESDSNPDKCKIQNKQFKCKIRKT